MRAYSSVNFEGFTIRANHGPGVLVGAVHLNPGSYFVWARLTLMVKVPELNQSPPPPPIEPYPSTTFFDQFVVLALGTAADYGYFQLKPEYQESIDMVSLMCAATISRASRARLYVSSSYPVPIHVVTTRILALQVEGLEEIAQGTYHFLGGVPQDEEEQLRDAVLRAKLTDLTRLSSFLKEE